MRTNIDWQIIENVKMLRKERQISQRVLADIIGTSYGFVGDVENPKSYCKYSAYHLYLIAKYFECEFADLFPPIDRLEP
ncbi:MAG: helix-turn-helix domain-containing protein [Alistipes sp.]|nr:helix-turn-helix domain-containing protein [Alistipes sp.]